MSLSGIEIFKYLPAGKKQENANCKKCGCSTCMAFALKLAKQKIKIDACSFVCEELKNKYFDSIKNPQKTINICGYNIGGENVLYRHEKTFVNKPPLCVEIDFESENAIDLISRINNFKMKTIGGYLGVDFIIAKNLNGKIFSNINIPIIEWQDFTNKEIYIINDDDFNKTKSELIEIRKKSVETKDEKYSNPVCVVLKDENLGSICAKASYYICKYANILVFKKFDSDLFSTLLMLRENIYTNPEQNLQVESGLYEFNNPDKDSIVFLTTNFALTFFAVANELESLDCGAYLIVIPSDGMSVLTAWSAEKFTSEIVNKTLKDLDIKNKINTKNIIIPGLLSHIKDELNEQCPDFNFVVGTQDAGEISNFVKNLLN